MLIDPDGLIEDKDEIINSKLSIWGVQVQNPDLLPDLSNDISFLPKINIFDIYNYLMTLADYEHSLFRDYKKWRPTQWLWMNL